MTFFKLPYIYAPWLHSCAIRAFLEPHVWFSCLVMSNCAPVANDHPEVGPCFPRSICRMSRRRSMSRCLRAQGRIPNHWVTHVLIPFLENQTAGQLGSEQQLEIYVVLMKLITALPRWQMPAKSAPINRHKPLTGHCYGKGRKYANCLSLCPGGRGRQGGELHHAHRHLARAIYTGLS